MSREECERHLRRAVTSIGWLAYAMLGAGLFGAVAGAGALVLFYQTSPEWQDRLARSESAQTSALIVGVTVLVLAAALSALLMRDLVIYLGIKREIFRARCPKCKQSLLGVPVHAPHSGGQPIPGDAWVRCPECGKRHNLMKIGLTPRELIPFEFREPSPDLARKRGDWFGREFRDEDESYDGW